MRFREVIASILIKSLLPKEEAIIKKVMSSSTSKNLIGVAVGAAFVVVLTVCL